MSGRSDGLRGVSWSHSSAWRGRRPVGRARHAGRQPHRSARGRGGEGAPAHRPGL